MSNAVVAAVERGRVKRQNVIEAERQLKIVEQKIRMKRGELEILEEEHQMWEREISTQLDLQNNYYDVQLYTEIPRLTPEEEFALFPIRDGRWNVERRDAKEVWIEARKYFPDARAASLECLIRSSSFSLYHAPTMKDVRLILNAALQSARTRVLFGLYILPPKTKGKGVGGPVPSRENSNVSYHEKNKRKINTVD